MSVCSVIIEVEEARGCRVVFGSLPFTRTGGSCEWGGEARASRILSSSGSGAARHDDREGGARIYCYMLKSQGNSGNSGMLEKQEWKQARSK